MRIKFKILYYIKQIDSMLPWVCSVIDHRRRQNVIRTSVTHSAIASCATFLFLPHFDVICDLLLNRRTATWNLFVKLTTDIEKSPGPRSVYVDPSKTIAVVTLRTFALGKLDLLTVLPRET